MAFARKAPLLFELKPEIAVIQECSRDSITAIEQHGYAGRWFGDKTDRAVPHLT